MSSPEGNPSPSFATWRAGGYANTPRPRRADPASLQTLAGRTMGTTWSLRFDNPRMVALDAVRAGAQGALDRVVAQMSTWEPDSDISRFNRSDAGSRQVLEPEFAEVLACALQWAAASDGAIDPSIGPLVALWGFGAQADASVAGPPSPAELSQARQCVGWQRVVQANTPAVMLPWLSRDLAEIEQVFGADHWPYGVGPNYPTLDATCQFHFEQALSNLGLLLLRQGKYADAEAVLRECLAIREKKAAGSWVRFNTASMLGGSLLGQGRDAEAEPLLRAGYEGMKARESGISPLDRARFNEAADRLVRLCEATGRPAEADKWRAERAKYAGVPAPPPAVK